MFRLGPTRPTYVRPSRSLFFQCSPKVAAANLARPSSASQENPACRGDNTEIRQGSREYVLSSAPQGMSQYQNTNSSSTLPTHSGVLLNACSGLHFSPQNISQKVCEKLWKKVSFFFHFAVPKMRPFSGLIFWTANFFSKRSFYKKNVGSFLGPDSGPQNWPQFLKKSVPIFWFKSAGFLEEI